MDREISADRKFGRGMPRYEAWIDPAWTIGLLLGAMVLFMVNLGGVALRDWDEGIVAQIAREISNSSFSSLTWLYPKELNGNPYFNKPPLVHWLVALVYQIGGINEWTSRLPGAMLTTTSVPLLYWIGREIFFQRPPAIFAALAYLTWLPVVRLGRLAMLDGAVLCFFLFMMLCLLRSRRDLRWGLGVGLGFGCLCLTKGILGLLLGAIALVFLAWDTPRLLTSAYLWSGFLLGCVPVALWYGAQFQHYGQTFVTAHFLNQSLKRVSGTVENNKGPIWYYGLEILKYGVPWLLFVPQGLRLAWENRTLGWAKLILLWSGIYFGVISLMQTKLPWYGLPVYPALALSVGVQLNQMWNSINSGWNESSGLTQPHRRINPTRIWIAIFALLAGVAWAGSAYYALLARPQTDLQLVFSTLALTLTVTTFLIARQDSQFISVLIWGTYLTLLVFMMSRHWLWELEEQYPVKPVAALIHQTVPKGSVVYTSHPLNRPSLNFYSERVVMPESQQALKKHWQEGIHPYLLVEENGWVRSLPPQQVQVLGIEEGWALVTRTTSPVFKPIGGATVADARN